MSATNRGAKRREADFYPTPSELAERIVRRQPLAEYARVLEPSVGSGAFLCEIRAYFPTSRITAIDPSDTYFPTHLATEAHRTTLEHFAASRPDARFDLIIGNPPFSLAEEHVRICSSMLAPDGRLVFLLRLAFLETRKRAKLWRECQPAKVTVLRERPSFTSDGKTDSCAYAVFEWRQGFAGKPELGWM